jgi:hypothetical protein
VNAISKVRNKGDVTQSPLGGVSADDGSLTISREQLEAFGYGDAHRGRKELRALLANCTNREVFSGPTRERPKTVRMATPDDEPAILELLLLDLRENAEHIAPIDEAKVLENIRAGTRLRGGVTAVIDDKASGKPIAVVLMHPYQHWWSQAYYWFEIALFVHPDHRKSRHVDDLLEFERWATDNSTAASGVRWLLICGVLGAWRVQAKIALYRRRFWQAGAAFCYPRPPMKGN